MANMLSYALCMLSAFIASTLAQTDDSVFYSPPVSGSIHDYSQDDVWLVGSTQAVEWYTQYETASLVLWQNNNPNSKTLQSFTPGNNTFIWIVDLGPFDLADGAVFFFQMYNGSTSQYFSSHYFNMTTDASVAAAATSSTSPSPPRSTSTATSAAASIPSNSSSASSSPASSSGLSTGAIVGISVAGIALVALALIGAIAFFIMRRRKARRVQGDTKHFAEMPESREPASAYPQSYNGGSPVSPLSPYGGGGGATRSPLNNAPSEMPVQGHRVEMPAGETRYELPGGKW